MTKNKIVFGIAGEIASGKGTVARYIVEEYKASYYRFSDMLRDILKRLHLENSRDNMQKLSTAIRKNYGEEIMAKVIMEDVKNDNSENKIVVVEGIRRLADIKYLRELPIFRLIYVDADLETRYNRIIRRDENPDDKEKTFEDFQKDHESEAESQVIDLKNYADKVLDNNGEFRDLYRQIDEILQNK